MKRTDQDIDICDCLTLGIVTFVVSAALFILLFRIFEIHYIIERGLW